MPGNDPFISSDATSAWLNQFMPEEQVLLTMMLRQMRLVSSDEFSQGLRELVLARLAAHLALSPVGLYAEREVRKHSRTKSALPLFKQTRGKVRRALSTYRAIDPTLPWKQEVGSEGIVAQLITELNRTHGQCLNHPNARMIRDRKVRRVMVITDFIGSGQQLSHFLDAIWATWSMRSWHSSQANKGMRFEVIAYSATEPGRQRIEAHKTCPQVSLVAACPTIASSFSAIDAESIRQLCIDRDPGDHDPVRALGYEGTGALIAFAHGAPNNVPRLLIEPSKRKPIQHPLFHKRVTADLRSTFSSALLSKSDVEATLVEMGKKRFAQAGLVDGLPIEAAKHMLVLATLTMRKKKAEVISARTGLTIPEVDRALEALFLLGWITPERQLTEAGQRELAKHPTAKQPPTIPPEPKSDYYPQQLRVPV
ncbi:hypothetical protein V2H26_11195 [Xanthomonas euvesicatoria]|uniref:phosphoribosyltransferase-like protein n=1 Tax=Xanthomonas citri TaxID=346 RepID=UPI000F806C7A|nr:hypothetical protein [Xanthomonas axonopodis]MEE5090606.1 hypothetical protein [Xanthomonas euvesicatoria]RTE58626.1 hypothetical protein EI541_07420 [Xanthomonas axonopodis pv. eucalyptorum]